MNYTGDYEQIAEYLRLALGLMGRYSIPVNPVNYSVWFEYVAGVNRELNEAIDARIAGSQAFTEEVNNDLYRRYVADVDFNRKDQVLQEVRSLLLNITEQLIEVGRIMSNHGHEFESYSKKLESDIGMDDLRNILSDVIQETRNTIKTGKNFNQSLTSNTSELDLLRAELEKVRETASKDRLTGLTNRHALEAVLESEVREAANSGRPLCVLFVDIDHFKRINDTHGHLVGDMVLKMSAAIMKSLIKGADTAGRYGGEEFVIVLPDTPIEGAMKIAEKIRGHFENKEWKNRNTGQSIGAITMSFGVSRYRPGESVKDLLQRADEAMYQSKRNGRNRVTAERG